MGGFGKVPGWPPPGRNPMNVDLGANTLSVRRTLSAAKEGPTFTTPKCRRKVTLTEGAVEAFSGVHEG